VDAHSDWEVRECAGIRHWHIARGTPNVHVWLDVASGKWRRWVVGEREQEICELEAVMVVRLSRAEVENAYVRPYRAGWCGGAR